MFQGTPILAEKMNLDDSVSQISSMCPSFTYDEIKHDLSITNSVERTVNRLLDKSISDKSETQPVMDFSSDDEELPVIFKPSSKPNLCKASTLNKISTDSSAKPSNEQISIILDSDEENKQSTKINIAAKPVYHSMSDSSEDEPCLPSLRDRILGSVSSNSSKHTSTETSPLSRPVSASKRELPLENNMKRNILNSGNLDSEFHSNEGEFSERSDYSDQSTERWSTRSESQSIRTLSQSSECSGGEVIKKKRTKEEILILKREAEKRKREKKKAREEKVLEKEQEKQRREQIRNAEREMKKQMGGSKDCLQYMILVLDTRIVNSGGHGVAIFKACEALGIQYITEEQTVPFSITWKRQITSINVSEENQVKTVNSEQLEDDVLVLLPVADFVMFVQNHKKGQYGAENEGPTLNSYVHTVKQHLPKSILSFVVIGMEKYFRDQKTKVQRKHRAAVLSSERVDTSADTSSVNRLDVEEAITDNQLQTDVMVYLLETSEELAEFVRTFSKAVAEKPAKKGRLQSAFFDDGIATVKVDKNGHGLLKVWKQQLMQFKNISPDIADAIVVAYPSPHLLMEAYRKCSDSNEQQKLLENIVVRRGAGVLETSRRVGKEMSRRIFTFMLSDNPNEIIK
ncbi:crossover junction endonuclease EME1-like [Saccostrea echinata]|uniref:crossover junction endonuclease EME1-like n=1 Tax=Saccostrea echinata TaxID=191078 RepID=UPI002A834BFB|nr:crossover junction endonuclease EME1-like [Saccostrea echinata]